MKRSFTFLAICASVFIFAQYTGRVGINTVTPGSTLQVNGSVAASIRSFSGNVLDSDYTVMATGDLTLPTPSAENTGRIYHILNDTGNNININGTFRVNGGNFSNYGLNRNAGGRAVTIQSNGSAWVVIGGY